MKIIFATTNNRKLEDIKAVIKDENLDMEVLSMADIGWDRGEIEENGQTIEENSLIKANAIHDFCKDKNIKYPIVTDDSGLFVDALGGAPGIYTARFADEEIKQNPALPKWQAIYKMLDKMQDKENRDAEYRCCVTIMLDDGTYKQYIDKSEGFIAQEISEPIAKPYLYSVFIDKKSGIPFNKLHADDAALRQTYRFKALKKALNDLGEKFELNNNQMK